MGDTLPRKYSARIHIHTHNNSIKYIYNPINSIIGYPSQYTHIYVYSSTNKIYYTQSSRKIYTLPQYISHPPSPNNICIFLPKIRTQNRIYIYADIYTFPAPEEMLMLTQQSYITHTLQRIDMYPEYMHINYNTQL